MQTKEEKYDMDQTRINSAAVGESQPATGASDSSAVAPQHGNPTPTSCPTCGNAGQPAVEPTFVYAIGRIVPRFSRVCGEKEFLQVMGTAETASLTDRQALQSVLSKPENRYLARQMCWVFLVQGLETYILMPRDPFDFHLLVESLRPTPNPLDLEIVIGLKGPLAPPEMCNGLTVPIVAFDQIYSFDRDALMKAIPRPEKTSAKEFTHAAEELFERILQLADNAGATDDHRALNFLVVRYHRIYEVVAESFARSESLIGVYVKPSPLSGTRKVVEVILVFVNRATDVETKQFVRVDVTEEFPFLVTKLSPYYDR
jgi:hypothetical protein